MTDHDTSPFIPNPAASADDLGNALTLELCGLRRALTVLSVAVNPDLGDQHFRADILAEMIQGIELRIELVERGVSDLHGRYALLHKERAAGA